MNIDLNYKNQIFHNINDAVQFLIDINAVQTYIVCEKCHDSVNLRKINKRGDVIYLYKCTKKNCRFSKNLMSCSVFKGTKIKLPTLLFSIYCIMGNISNYFFTALVDCSENSFIKLKNQLMEVQDIMLNNSERIGGEGIHIEVDETVVSRNGTIRNPSSIDDETPGTVWLFGMIERENPRNFRLEIVPDRRSSTLARIMGNHVRASSTIVSDGYPSYPRAVRSISCSHIVVPHIDGFVTSDGESTNKIENLWSHLKSDIRKKHGVAHNNLSTFLKQFSFRKKFLTNSTKEQKKSIFIRICQLMFLNY